MEIKTIISCVMFVACSVGGATAQQSNSQQPTTAAAQEVNEPRVALTEQATAFDAKGATALAGRLRTTTLNATPDAPVRNVNLVVENRSAFFYNYVSGWATFYDAQGVRCGEGLFKLDALAVGESAEADTPGLRLTCAPATWRITATNLLTRTSDTAKPNEPPPTEPAQASQPAAPPATADATSSATAGRAAPPVFVDVEVDGKTYRVPAGSQLDIPVKRRRVKIIVGGAASPAP